MTRPDAAPRRRLAARARLALFLKARGRCAACHLAIHAGQTWHVDHVRPLSLGGDDGPDNLQVLCRACHREKTRRDIARMAKAIRQQVRHHRADRPRRPLPCGRSSPWKKTIGGRVIRRV
jgi:5-methylcytosine-specific restriction endonuclease McrA